MIFYQYINKLLGYYTMYNDVEDYIRIVLYELYSFNDVN